METCNICYYDHETTCTFNCNHKMCFNCFLKYSEENHVCHICRVAINYDKLQLNNGNTTLFFIDFRGDMRTLFNINLEKITCIQLYRIIELKMFGCYYDELRIIHSGRQLKRDNNIISAVRPVITDSSTLHCVPRLRAD